MVMSVPSRTARHSCIRCGNVELWLLAQNKSNHTTPFHNEPHGGSRLVSLNANYQLADASATQKSNVAR
jgi:hypothetical protein